MNILIILILGFITSILFPPYFFIPLGFVLFPFLCFLYDEKFKNYSKLKLFNSTLIYFFGFYLSFLFWIKEPFLTLDETENIFFISILLIILLSLISSFVVLIFIFFLRDLHGFFAIPLLFTIIEFTISKIAYGFPWITFSLIISSNDILLPIIKNYGTLITSLLTIQIFCIPYLYIIPKNRSNILKNFSIFLGLPLTIIFLLNITTNEKFYENTKVDIEIFQMNYDSSSSDNPEKRLNEIIDLVSNTNSDILIFGENNYPYLIKKIELDVIKKVLKKNQILIIGGTRYEKDQYYNSLFNITSEKVTNFDKKILVPFGEFLPLRKYLNFFYPISGPVDYSKGNTKRIIKLKNNLSYIPVICYEIIFYWKLLNKSNFNSNLIINITNDIWFGNYIGPYQHFYLTKLRAAEFNKSIVRVSNNGISAIFSKNGKLAFKSKLNQKGSYKLSIELDSNKNFISSHNYLIIYLTILFVLLIFYYSKKRMNVDRGI